MDPLATLRARLAQLERDLADAALRGDARAVDVATAALRAVAQAAREIEAARLTADPPERTIRTVDVDTRGMPASVKRGAARATRRHVAQQRFYAARKTITDIAGELRETRERVSSWMAVGSGNRPIPRRHAEYLRERYHVPLAAWKRIAE